MTPYEIIESVFGDAKIPYIQFNEEDANKEEVIEFFKKKWDLYWSENIDEKFTASELRLLWFYLRVKILYELMLQGDRRARILLSHEMNLNAKTYESKRYRPAPLFEARHESNICG